MNTKDKKSFKIEIANLKTNCYDNIFCSISKNKFWIICFYHNNRHIFVLVKYLQTILEKRRCLCLAYIHISNPGSAFSKLSYLILPDQQFTF